MRFYILFIIFLAAYIQAAAQPAEFPAKNRDGKQFVSVIGRECYTPTYNDKVFYVSSNSNSPSFLFPDYGQIDVPIGGCGIGRKYMYWLTEYKVDGLSNVRTLTINPSAGDQTKTIIVVSHNVRRTQCIGGGESHEYNNVKSFTVKFESPEFKGLDDIKKICNNINKDYNLNDFFTVQEGVTFYLDNLNNPITIFNPKDLTPGFHRLLASKVYDNGTLDPTYGSTPGTVVIQYEFQVLEGVKIEVPPYPAALCSNAPPIAIKMLPAGGQWEGRGIDGNGNFNPSSATVGRNLLLYKITATNGCVSEKELEINIHAVPDVTVSDIDVCLKGGQVPLTIGQPAGGIYTGRGVVNGNEFNPTQALVGRNVVHYTFTDAKGCTVTKDFYANVLDAENFNVGEDLTLCNTSEEIDLNKRPGVNPTDGSITWSGPGVIRGKTFSPASARLGLNAIIGRYYIPTTGCTYEKTFIIKVIDGPEVDAGPLTVVCQNAKPVRLSGSSPLGGKWSGEHVSGNMFDPSQAAPGDYEIIYTYNNGVCSVSDSRKMIVNAPPAVALGNPFTVCSNYGLYDLPQATPAGGVWTADGPYLERDLGKIAPHRMKIGDNKLTYTYTDPDGICTVSADLIVTAVAPPAVTAGNDFSTCINSDPITLAGEPTGGTWSGPGVTGSKFFPARAGAGEHLLQYVWTDPNTKCYTFSKLYVTVKPLPAIDAGIDLVVCETQGIVKLAGAVPSGGVWTGDHVTGNSFDPGQAKAGEYILTYTFRDGTCTVSDTRNVVVKSPPAVSVGNALTICSNYGLYDLPSATPAGGSWTADGPYLEKEIGKIAPPRMKIGDNKLSYTYISPDGVCKVAAELIVTVVAPPVVNAGSDFTTCINHDPILLGGEPAGGIWSGSGVTGSKFFPARAGVGEHLLQYVWTDPTTKCYTFSKLYVTVKEVPGVDAGNDLVLCQTQGAVQLVGAIPAGGNWSGDYIEKGNFHADQASPGIHTVTYNYNDGVCTVTDTRNIIVIKKPEISFGEPMTVCRNAGLTALPTPSLSGGKWTADGPYLVPGSNNNVDPLKMRVGINRLSYSYSAYPCQLSVEFNIIVIAPPDVIAGNSIKTCINAVPFMLPGDPKGGQWSGAGVDQNYFNPSLAGAGEHLLQYVWTDPLTGCSNGDSLYIKVQPPPHINAGENQVVCKNMDKIYLSGASPIGGTWTGDFIVGNYFDASQAPVGKYVLTYTFNDGLCTNSKTKTIQVVAPPAVNAGMDFMVCQGDPPFAPPMPYPAGGQWAALSGGFYNEVQNLIDPGKMQAGANYLVYTYITPEACSIKDTVRITLNSRPNILGMRDFSSCANGAQVILQANPQSGIWQGPGVSANQGNFFIPGDAGPGSHAITYTVADENGCLNSDTVLVTVTAPPMLVTPPDTSICIASGMLSLRGFPSGGTWSGPGITGSNMNPVVAGVGNSILQYLYTDPVSKCSSIGSFNVLVKGTPGQLTVTGDTVACNGSILTLSASAENVNLFRWFRATDTIPFAEANTIQYKVTADQRLTVKPLPIKAGDCPGTGHTFSITDNTPTGKIEYSGDLTLDFGAFFSASALLNRAASVRWEFGDGTYSNQLQGNHYFYTPGPKYISLTATGSTGCQATFSLPPVVIRNEEGKTPTPGFDRGEGIDKGHAGLNIFPNPFSDNLRLEVYLKSPQILFIELFNFSGKKLSEVKLAGVTGVNRFSIAEAGRIAGHGVWIVVKVTSTEVNAALWRFKL